MTKTTIPLRAEDLSAFTRALSRQLGATAPSHLSLMNMIARAAGFQNVQHLNASHAALRRLNDRAEAPPQDARSVEAALRQFDPLGRLRQWPAKRSVQTLALWALWASLPAGQRMPERDINTWLGREHLFADPATIRRTMVSCGLLTRRADGTDYARVEREPPPEAKTLIRALRPRRDARAAAGLAVTDA